MSSTEFPAQRAAQTEAVSHREQALRDYVDIGRRLLLQRQVIFLAATVLGVGYFDPVVAITCYLGVLTTEIMDMVLFRNVVAWKDHSPVKAWRFHAWVMFNTICSAGSISLFVTMIALQQQDGGRFTPLFFLFAASLFAAMNNHQIIAALAVRLMIYGATFLYISLMDVLPHLPPLSDPGWLQFFTAIFVIYFILDCSFEFLKLYRKNLRQMDELRVEHDRAVRAYEVKSKFVSTVSHELRTPLTSIKASVDLINMGLVGQVTEKQAAILKTAGKNAKRLADLINDLLDAQKIEAGEMSYHFAPVNVRALVLESVEANRGFADQACIGFECTFPDQNAFILGDEARLMQVMANLISNAIKFSKKDSSVIIAMKVRDGRVRITVKDNGAGIDAEARDLVFGKFTQIDNTDQRRFGGTGLGMHISKQIVERHDGIIDFDSTLGQGTSFYIEFAAIGAPQAQAHPQDRAAA
jgi:signal transduction histidine kinase